MGRRKMRGPTKAELQTELKALRDLVSDYQEELTRTKEDYFTWKKAYGDITLKLQKAHMKLGEIVCRK